ncbi:MAG: S1C family serine protease [Fimbriimonadaceae bacterium]|nr:hypothetical protein [Fimbriimonadaceae bacterium]MCL4285428.1 S1C family serine protease [Fimbriimonadaceae bacterium]QOJ11862.1 MAG: serine protease [Chthonomonadaceae bacterium]
MWSLAVNWGIAAAVLVSGQGVTEREQSLFDQLRPSVILLSSGVKVTGTAACIDPRGYFVTHRSALEGLMPTARTFDGAIVPIRIQASDELTELVLLTATLPIGRIARAVPVLGDTPDEGTKLLAIFAGGPGRAEVSSDNKTGILSRQRRVVTLTELRFELPQQAVGGGLVFTLQGQLAGIIGATLQAQVQDAAKSLGATGAFRGSSSPPTVISQYGPSALAVGYSVSSRTLARVIEGFLSPDHIVRHPGIGVFCRDAEEPGALVQSVVKGSPAEKAGLQANDLIVEFAGKPILNQIEFFKALSERKVGETVRLTVKREEQPVILSLTIGELTD